MPRFVCPFGRDLDFIERPVLAELFASKGPGSRHALVGGGGIGYVHNNPTELTACSVIWGMDRCSY
jgi:hypothetical protein